MIYTAVIFVSAAIGYATNWVAIKMLFWPRAPIYILGVKLPLTPGLFVKRQREFATSIGQLVEVEFIGGKELYAGFLRLQDSGLVKEVIEKRGPLAIALWNSFADRLGPGGLEKLLGRVADRLKKDAVVRSVIGDKVAAMDVEVVESMVLSVVEDELMAITWFGAALGGLIGVLQVLFLLQS